MPECFGKFDKFDMVHDFHADRESEFLAFCEIAVCDDSAIGGEEHVLTMAGDRAQRLGLLGVRGDLDVGVFYARDVGDDNCDF